MKNIILSESGKPDRIIPLIDMPYSEPELTRQVTRYYRKPNCQRCREAVLRAALYRLMSEAETVHWSDETLRLFPVLLEYATITIAEDG